MRFEKKSLTQWVTHRCERQLGLSLWTDREQRADAAAGSNGHGIPHRQIRPGLQQMATAGDDWQAEKTADLLTVFGPAAVAGSQNGSPQQLAPGNYTSAPYNAVDLGTLLPGATPGQFIIEGEFDPMNPVFEAQWQLAWRTGINLGWSHVRPDMIEVRAPGSFDRGITASGAVLDLVSDNRTQLRVIDAKLSSNPGAGYFSEVTYYSVALAAWIQHQGIEDQYVVAADAAIWPGSHETAAVRTAQQNGEPPAQIMRAFDEVDLMIVPVEVFVSALGPFFAETLPRVATAAAAAGWQQSLAWHVNASCAGCDYLGQSFPNVNNPGATAAAHTNHCVPMASQTDHLSRLPFLPRGGTTILSRQGITTTNTLVGLPSTSAQFDEHHSLRAGRAIIPARAGALHGGPIGLGDGQASTSAIPKWSDLSLYVTADFDPTSAITLAFGLSGFFMPSQYGQGAGQANRPYQPATYMVQQRTVLAERAQLDVFLQAIRNAMNSSAAVDANATMQIYAWDTLTFQHLTRVIGRHLDWLLASNNIAALAWLFPPEDLLGNPSTEQTPAVSIVGDAVRGVLATSQPHTYTLLGTARVYNEGGGFNLGWLNTPPFWTTEFSDQIPGERAFDLWTHRNRPNLPYTQLVNNLDRTVKARHRALSTVVRRLRDDLRQVLTRKAPAISRLNAPGFVTGTSMLGSLLYFHAKLNAATAWQENQRARATAPHEREARFQSVICEQQLTGPAATTAAQTLALTPGPHTRIYRISPGSAEAKIEAGGFTWAISGEPETGLLDRSLYATARNTSAAQTAWWANKPYWMKSFEDALGVVIRGFDRHNMLIAVELSNPDAVAALTAANLVDLSGRCIIDPTSKDFLSPKIKKAAEAIKNPPKAAIDDAVARVALGVTTRGPRRTATCPPEDFLWDPTTLEATQLARPVATIKNAVQADLAGRGEHDLDLEQWQAWEHALTRRLTLIWGPPGTGKSRTVVVTLDGLLQIGGPLRILVTAVTYTAMDNVVEETVRRHPSASIFRVRSGARSGPPWATAAGVDTSTDDQADMQRLIDAFNRQSGPVIVGAAPQQAQKVIDAISGSASGPVFDVIIVDEAGQLDVGNGLLVLAGVKDTAQVIVAGDPLQLPPIHAVEPPDTLEHTVGPIYSFLKEKHSVPENVLLTNYRSNAEIVDLAKTGGYPAGFRANSPQLRLPPTPPTGIAPAGWPAGITWDPMFDVIVDPDKPVVCLTYAEGVAGQWNHFEADLTVGLTALTCEQLAARAATEPAGWLFREGVGVITPHRAQRALLTTGLQQAFPAIPVNEIDASVDTVERFQGQERWAILASYAVGDPDTVADEDEFLQNLNRFNVLATRAKAKVIVTITDEVLAHIATDLKVIRSSRLIKSFADTYCNQRAHFAVTHIDRQGNPQAVDLTIRWCQ